MKRKESEFIEIPYMASFKEMFTITDDLNLLLNGIEVYSCINSLSMGKLLNKPVNISLYFSKSVNFNNPKLSFAIV